MVLQDFLNFHFKFKEVYKIEPVYTGSVSLFLTGYVERIPKDIDLTMDEISYQLLLEGGNASDYEDSDCLTLYFQGQKIDVFLDKQFPKKTVDFFGQQFFITEPIISIEKKIMYLEKYVNSLKEGSFLNSINMGSFFKHSNDVNYYNNKRIKERS